LKLLPFYNDQVFKAVFTKNLELLKSLLNSFPEFQKDKKIGEIQIISSELNAFHPNEKQSFF
jgi:hypothetical protein